MATTAKKFVKVTGLSQVFVGSSAAGNWHGYDISQVKTGLTAADNNSLLFIEDAEWGKWIWAQGRMYSGNDMTQFEIGVTGDMWIGATATRDEAGNVDIEVTHQGASATYGTTGASAAASGSNFVFSAVTEIGSDARGHVTSVVGTTFTIPVAGVTGDAKVKVGASGTQYYVTHATGASGTFTSSKSASGNEVTVTNPVLTFDETGHLSSTGSTSYKITAADLGVDGVLHFLGVTTTDPSLDPTNPAVVIDDETVTAKKGDIVLYGTKEYVWSGTKWEELGDESKYLLGATGDNWIGATTVDGIVNITHKTAGTATQGSTGGFITSITYDANGHVVAVGKTGISVSTIGVTGPTSNGTAQIKMTGEDGGYVNVVGASGIEVKVTTAGTNAGVVQISQTDSVTPASISGTTYKIADIYLSGKTSILAGKDTTYTVGGTAVTGTSGANIIVGATSSTGVYTGATIPVISKDDSILITAESGKVAIDYTGVSTPDDWGFIPES